jgi:hypothetical protein
LYGGEIPARHHALTAPQKTPVMLLGDSAKSTVMNLPHCVHECVHDRAPLITSRIRSFKH